MIKVVDYNAEGDRKGKLTEVFIPASHFVNAHSEMLEHKVYNLNNSPIPKDKKSIAIFIKQLDEVKHLEKVGGGVQSSFTKQYADMFNPKEVTTMLNLDQAYRGIAYVNFMAKDNPSYKADIEVANLIAAELGYYEEYLTKQLWKLFTQLISRIKPTQYRVCIYQIE